MMKKFVFIALLALATGCATCRTASEVAKEAYIGMSIKEFKRLAGPTAELEAMTADYTVYRIDIINAYNEQTAVSGAKFFHFDANGKLYKIDSKDFRWYDGRRR